MNPGFQHVRLWVRHFFNWTLVLSIFPFLAAEPRPSFSKLPVSFEKNVGQADRDVKFLSRADGHTLFLTTREAVLTRGSDSLRMKLMGANAAAQVEGLDELPGKSNYFVGNDPTKWRRDVPQYAKVEYRGVYPGVNLVFYESRRQLEYDWVVAPGADPRVIRVRFEGARRVRIDSAGDLVLETAGGEMIQRKPRIYQDVAGVSRPIEGRYLLRGAREVGFQVDAYDASQPLVIDPLLVYASYFGGSDCDEILGIAVDATANVYIAGHTCSTNLRTSGFSTVPGSVFVAKFKTGLSSLVYSTYLGDRGLATASGIAVDSAGNAYVTGKTNSTTFPVVNAIQKTLSGGGNAKCAEPITQAAIVCSDAFITKLNPTGSALIYSTYLGGSGEDAGNAIAVDSAGSAYVTGSTASSDFPRKSPLPGCSGFVAKLNAAGSALDYSSPVGGCAFSDYGTGIAVDSSGSAYVTGVTFSTDFPIERPFQSAARFGVQAFVTKINPAGSARVYSTYLGGRGETRATGIAVDKAGSAYVTGWTFADDFPRSNPKQFYLVGSSDAFITRFDQTGLQLIFSTYLGATNAEQANAIALDSFGNAYITGLTQSTQFPVVNPVQPNFGGGVNDAFVAELDSFGSPLIFSTYLGAGGNDQGNAIAVDANGLIYVAGQTDSANFPTTGAAFQQGSFGGISEGFIVKLGEAADVYPSVVASNSSVSAGSNLIYTITVNNNGPAPATNVIVTDVLASGINFASVSASQGSCSGTSTVTCNVGTVLPGRTATVNLGVVPTVGGHITNTATVAADQYDPAPANNTGTSLFTNVIVPPTLALSSTSLSFAAPIGGANPPNQTITVSNSGSATFNWTATAAATGGNWLTVSPASGAPGTMTVSVNSSGLAAGNYSGTIQVTAPGAANSPQTIQVSLAVFVPTVATISLSPGVLPFSTAVGASPAAQTFQVLNTGTGTLNWTASTTTLSGGSWLTVNPAFGAAPSTVTVTINAASLAAGSYSGIITITAAADANANNSPQTLNIALSVGAPSISTGGVVSAAGFGAAISRGSIGTIFGAGFADTPTSAPGVPLPRDLQGIHVTVGGFDAPLYYVSPGQVNFQAPFELPLTGTASVILSKAGVPSQPAAVTLQDYAPGIFTYPGAGGVLPVIVKLDGSLITPANPARPGDVLVVYATGLGDIVTPQQTGAFTTSDPLPAAKLPATASLGTATIAVDYAGLTPQLVGLAQFNLTIPKDVGLTGAQSFSVKIGNSTSNSVSLYLAGPSSSAEIVLRSRR